MASDVAAVARLPWWRTAAARPTLVPEAPLHVAADLALVVPGPVPSPLAAAAHPAPFPAALTLRQPGHAAAVAVLAGVPPTVRDRESPRCTTAVHLTLPAAARFVGTGGHIEVQGVRMTDALVRHLIAARLPLSTLRLGRARAGNADTPARRIVPPVWRQLVDQQAAHGLRCLCLSGFPGARLPARARCSAHGYAALLSLRARCSAHCYAVLLTATLLSSRAPCLRSSACVRLHAQPHVTV